MMHPFKLLKSVKGGGVFYRAVVLWLCFKLPSCLFGNVRDKPVVHEKAKLLLTFCLLLLHLWESIIVLCFVVRYFMSILVLQTS